MSKSKSKGHSSNHPIGCGCQPKLFVNMIENAGLEFSRRQILKGAAALGGMLAAGGLSSCALAASKGVNRDAKADSIYHGGPLLTMTRDGDLVEALAVKDGHILAVGKLADVMPRKGADTKVVDLGGKALEDEELRYQSLNFSLVNMEEI